MGNTLAPMQRELTLANSDSARDARESLDRLEDMAKDRVDLFYERIGYMLPAVVYHVRLTFCTLAEMTNPISTSFESTRCSTSTPTSASWQRKTTFGLRK